MKLSDALEKASADLIFGKKQYWDGKAYCSIGALARSLGYADTELVRDRINWYAFTHEMQAAGVVLHARASRGSLLLERYHRIQR